MGPVNQIIKKIKVGEVMKEGMNIVCSIATETNAWKRSHEIVEKQGPGFVTAVQENKHRVSSGTKEIVLRDNQHTSSDPANHYTGIELSEVADDEKGPFNGKATHFPTKK